MAASDSEKDPAENAPEDSESEEKAADSVDEDEDEDEGEDEDEEGEGESDADAIDHALEAEEAAADADKAEEEESVEESKPSGSKGGNSGRAPKLPGVDMETGPPPATKKTPPSKPSRPIVTSGILDMRKLAAAYERELGAATVRAETDDEPPMLGSADLSGPQVMLPTAEPARGENRAMLMVLGAILAVILIGITALVTIFLVRHFSKEESKTPVAQADNSAGQPASVPNGTQPVTPAAAGDENAGNDVEPETNGADTEPSEEPKPGGEVKTPANKHDNSTTQHHSTHTVPKDDGKKDEPKTVTPPKDDGKKDEPKTVTPPKDDGKKDQPKTDGKKDACDEYVCLIEPDKPCCKKGAAAKDKSDKPKADTPALPERPSSADIQKGFSTLRPKLQGCADKNDFRGTANVKLAIAADGSVTKATTSAGTGIFQNCVESQSKRVTFAESQKGTSATFVLVSR